MIKMRKSSPAMILLAFLFLLVQFALAQEQFPKEFPKLDFALQELYDANVSGKNVEEIVKKFGLFFENGNVKVEVHHTGETFSAPNIGFKVESEDYGSAKGWIAVGKLKELVALENVMFVSAAFDENKLFAPPDLNMQFPGPGMNFPDMNMQMPEIGADMKIDPLLRSVIEAYKDGNSLSYLAAQYNLAVKGNRIKVSIAADKNFNPSSWNIKVEETETLGDMQRITAYLSPEEIEKIAKDSHVNMISSVFNFEMPNIELPIAMKLSGDLNMLIEEVKKGRKLKEVADELHIVNEGEKVLVEVILGGNASDCTLPKDINTAAKAHNPKAYLSLADIEETIKCKDVISVLAVIKPPELAPAETPVSSEQGNMALVYIGSAVAFFIFVFLGIFFVKKLKKVL